MTLRATLLRMRRAGWALALLAVLAQMAGVQFATAHQARMLGAAPASLQICSADGTRFTAPAGDDERSGTPRGHSLPCPACSVIAFALPPATPVLAAASPGAPGPIPASRAPARGHAAAPPQARGPPLAG